VFKNRKLNQDFLIILIIIYDIDTYIINVIMIYVVNIIKFLKIKFLISLNKNLKFIK